MAFSLKRFLFPVNVRPIPFDTDWIDIGGIATASVYTALDAVGGPFQLTHLPLTGEIRTVLVQDEDKEEISSVIHLFDEPLETVTADHAPFDVVSNDMNKQVGEVMVTGAEYTTSANSSFATVDGLTIRFTAPNGILTGHYKTLGTPNIASSKRLMVRFLGVSMSSDNIDNV